MRVSDWDDMRGYCDWENVPVKVKPELFWNEERTNTLRELWEDGVNATLAAKQLGCTKSAACGKANRLFLVHGSRTKD